LALSLFRFSCHCNSGTLRHLEHLVSKSLQSLSGFIGVGLARWCESTGVYILQCEILTYMTQIFFIAPILQATCWRRVLVYIVFVITGLTHLSGFICSFYDHKAGIILVLVSGSTFQASLLGLCVCNNWCVQKIENKISPRSMIHMAATCIALFGDMMAVLLYTPDTLFLVSSPHQLKTAR